MLTEAGWLFYVNLMYYFMPTTRKTWIADKIAQLAETVLDLVTLT